MLRIPALFFSLLLALGYSQAHEQIAAAKGRFMCGQRPARHVQVKLYDEDTAPDPDDLLDQSFTDLNGEFSLRGSTSEDGTIDPVLIVNHDCDDEHKPGTRVLRFRIPHSYITALGATERWFDLGTINLETRFSNEERQPVLPKHRRHRFYPGRMNYDHDFEFFDGF